jgi:hypothetical protein
MGTKTAIGQLQLFFVLCAFFPAAMSQLCISIYFATHWPPCTMLYAFSSKNRNGAAQVPRFALGLYTLRSNADLVPNNYHSFTPAEEFSQPSFIHH